MIHINFSSDRQKFCFLLNFFITFQFSSEKLKSFEYITICKMLTELKCAI